MGDLNETHDPTLQSWVDSANLPDTDFPVQNLPFGVFRRRGSSEAFRGGVAIGDQIVDLGAVHEQRMTSGMLAIALAAAAQPTLNRLMALGPGAASALRHWLSQALRRGSPQVATLHTLLVPQADAEYALAANVGNYTDFYTSIHHATAVGRLFRPDQPLLPNYKWLPVAYHGRASTVTLSGLQFQRPHGQLPPAGIDRPELGPTRRLDYELEVGIFVGPGNPYGAPIPVRYAERHIFGLCLLNDWSARDIQAWEYQPLGPFLGKNFATTISPWVVSLEALAPFRAPWKRPPSEPPPLTYLDCEDVRRRGAFDIQLEAYLETGRMRALSLAPQALSRSSFRHSWWTVAQMLTHHTINGCTLRPGDLLGSGTQSGPMPHEAGSLLELTAGGHKPIPLSSGETRSFLEDGDRVILRGYCEKPGHARVGFGEVSGTVLPAVSGIGSSHDT